MRNLKPSKHPKLVSIGAKGIQIEDLLTERIAGKLTWLNQRIIIGDAYLDKAKPLEESYKTSGGLRRFEDYFDLQSIAKDGLDNLMVVGFDGNGHEYFVGKKSRRFYLHWHGETQFEQVATSVRSFLEWVICKRSDHLEGCPWEVFTTGRTYFWELWRVDQIDPAPILDRAQELYAWDRQYSSPKGFELLNEEDKFDLRFKKKHRSYKSHIQLRAARKPPKFDSFVRWLVKRGFGQPECWE